ncbi:hypothetical protein K440DRAFT_619454 [Wilcoxina mikolae CBS 423.85]|nr:hypothetical protein K440DRAFT_619454 [Wilcoxina mikolae CBS 423.85]
MHEQLPPVVSNSTAGRHKNLKRTDRAGDGDEDEDEDKKRKEEEERVEEIEGSKTKVCIISRRPNLLFSECTEVPSR